MVMKNIGVSNMCFFEIVCAQGEEKQPQAHRALAAY